MGKLTVAKELAEGALSAVRRILTPFREPGRNVLVLPSMSSLNNEAQEAARLAVARAGVRPDGSDAYDITQKFSHVNDDVLRGQALAQAVGVSKWDADKGASLSPLWMHGKRLKHGRADIPSELVDRAERSDPLYLSDNPLIASTAEYATQGPYDDAERMLWPYLVDPKGVSTVTRSKGSWVSDDPELDKLLKGLGLDYAPSNYGYDRMIGALEQVGQEMPMPNAVNWRGVKDVAPMTQGSGFEWTNQNQMMLYRPRTMLDNGTLKPVFSDGKPFAHGGAV